MRGFCQITYPPNAGLCASFPLAAVDMLCALNSFDVYKLFIG